MVYTCDMCHFTFSRVGTVDVCPKCGKPSIRESTDSEFEAYNKNSAIPNGAILIIDPEHITSNDFINPLNIAGPGMKGTFIAKVELFERKKGWYYVPVPVEYSKPLEHLAERGLIAVTVSVGSSTWPTSMLPMGDGTHFIALPAKVRAKENLTFGMEIGVSFEVRKRND